MSENTKPKKVILDVDTGSDDAVAIMTALQSEELDVVAICCVWGNLSVEDTTENTCRLVRAMGKDTPVYMGAPTAIAKYLERDTKGGTDRTLDLQFQKQDFPLYGIHRNHVQGG